MPLALELAAAWVRVLSCAEIVADIEQSPGFLTTPSHSVPGRHRSMHAVFESSWQLLAGDEQRVLRQLAVFRGGCERGAAFEVVGATMQLLAALVDKSMLRRAANNRYELHELVRQYAEDKLVAADALVETRDRHLCFYLQLAEDMEQKLFGTEQEAVLGTLEVEHDNLRAALRWSMNCQKAEHALRLSGALWWFWWVRGHVSEGRAWLDAARAVAGSAPKQAHAKVLHGAGWLAVQQHEYPQAAALLEQSLALAQELHDTPRVVAVIHDLAQAARLEGDHGRAMALYEQSANLGHELGDRHMIGWSLGNLGIVAHAEGDDGRAADLLEANLAVMQELGDKVFQAWYLSFLGRVAKAQGTSSQAARRFGESLKLFCGAWDKDGMAFALEGYAGLAAAQGRAERAARLFGAAAALREVISSPMAPFDQPEYDRDVAAVRSQLDEALCATTWAEGRALTLEQAIAEALSAVGDEPAQVAAPHGMPDRRGGARQAAHLTLREVEVLQVVAEGATDQEVAARLGLRPRTVTTYLTRIYAKLAVGRGRRRCAWPVSSTSCEDRADSGGRQ